MSFLAVSSIVALLIKFSLFWVGKSALFRENQPLALLLVVLCALNLVELMSFVYAGNEHALVIVIQAYHAAAILAAAAFFYLSIHTTRGNKLYAATSFAASIIIAILTFIPGVMISGIESIGYSITRIPGGYFPILQIYLIGTLLLSCAILILGALKSTDHLVNKRSLIFLISAAPLVFFAITITITLSLGIKINGRVSPSTVT